MDNSWKMKCLDNDGMNWFTIGKVYNLVNGKLIDDNGRVVMMYKDFEKTASCLRGKWELVEDEIPEKIVEDKKMAVDNSEIILKRQEILREAEKCICVDRDEQYGSAEDNFQLIANYWNTYLKDKLKDEKEINAHDVGIMQLLLKVARIQTGKPKADNYVDLCGYTAISAQIAIEKDVNNK